MKQPNRRSRRGASLVEHVLVVMLVAIGSIGLSSLFGDNLRALLSAQSNCLAGEADCGAAARTASEEEIHVRPLTGLGPVHSGENPSGDFDQARAKSVIAKAIRQGLTSGAVHSDTDLPYTREQAMLYGERGFRKVATGAGTEGVPDGDPRYWGFKPIQHHTSADPSHYQYVVAEQPQAIHIDECDGVLSLSGSTRAHFRYQSKSLQSGYRTDYLKQVFAPTYLFSASGKPYAIELAASQAAADEAARPGISMMIRGFAGEWQPVCLPHMDYLDTITSLWVDPTTGTIQATAKNARGQTVFSQTTNWAFKSRDFVVMVGYHGPVELTDYQVDKTLDYQLRVIPGAERPQEEPGLTAVAESQPARPDPVDEQPYPGRSGWQGQTYQPEVETYYLSNLSQDPVVRGTGRFVRDVTRAWSQALGF